MKLRNLRLTLANVARTTNSKTMEVIGTGFVRKHEKDGTFSDEIEAYTVECAAYRGDTLKIKFPVKLADKIEELKTLLDDDKLIEISFTGLKLTPFAFESNGKMLSGVSGTADDFNIVVNQSYDDDLLL